MKKLCLVVVFLLTCCLMTGCMLKNNLDAEKSYYQMMTAIKTAQMQQASQPIFRLTPAKPGEPVIIQNLGALEIYQQIQTDKTLPPQYVHQDFGVKAVVNVAAAAVPYAGIYGVGKVIADAVKSNVTNYNQSITGENNTGRIAGPSALNSVVTGDGNTLGGAVEIPTTTTTTTTTIPTTTTNTTTNTTNMPTTTTTNTPTATTTTGNASVTP
jgi:hypothetical protein